LEGNPRAGRAAAATRTRAERGHPSGPAAPTPMTRSPTPRHATPSGAQRPQGPEAWRASPGPAGHHPSPCTLATRGRIPAPPRPAIRPARPAPAQIAAVRGDMVGACRSLPAPRSPMTRARLGAPQHRHPCPATRPGRSASTLAELLARGKADAGRSPSRPLHPGNPGESPGADAPKPMCRSPPCCTPPRPTRPAHRLWRNPRGGGKVRAGRSASLGTWAAGGSRGTAAPAPHLGPSSWPLILAPPHRHRHDPAHGDPGPAARPVWPGARPVMRPVCRPAPQDRAPKTARPRPRARTRAPGPDGARTRPPLPVRPEAGRRPGRGSARGRSGRPAGRRRRPPRRSVRSGPSAASRSGPRGRAPAAPPDAPPPPPRPPP